MPKHQSVPAEIPYRQALDLCLAAAPDLGEETLPLRRGLGRVLSRTVISPVSVPPTRNSAMDGYALPDDGGHPLGYYDRVPPQTPFVAGSNQARRVLTGQPVPDWAWCVAAEEHCRFEHGHLIPPTDYPKNTNIRPLGEDAHSGKPLLNAGTFVDAVALARLASAGVTRLPARRRPRILILTSGNELQRPGSQAPKSDAGAIAGGTAVRKFECDSTLLRSLLAEHGFSSRVLPHLPDRRDRFLQTLRGLKPFDLLLTCGGAANSEADHVRPALREVGAEFLFERVRVKPARPTALAHWRRGLVFCLPGNPVAVFVAFHAFVLPVLRAAHGHPDPTAPHFHARLAHDFHSDPRRHLLARVHLERSPDGITAAPHRESGSALLRTLMESDGLAVIEPGDIIPRGTPIPIIWSRRP